MVDEGIVFVTVGTTSFDALIQAVDSKACRDALAARGYSSVVLQIGRGSYVPQQQSGDGIRVEYFDFKPNLAQYMSSASLIISHAGSGSIFEALKLAKPLIVVVNEDLMDNHQCELAEELAKSKHLVCAKPRTLVEAVSSMDLRSLVPYPVSSPAPLVQALDSFLGFN